MTRSFADRARDQGRKPGTVCGVAIALAGMEPAYRAEVEEAIADGTIQGTAISRVLGLDNVRLSGDSINRHRRGDCHCGKAA